MNHTLRKLRYVSSQNQARTLRFLLKKLSTCVVNYMAPTLIHPKIQTLKILAVQAPCVNENTKEEEKNTTILAKYHGVLLITNNVMICLLLALY